MAGTLVQGNVSTEETLPEERAVDMDDRIRRLRDDNAQFTTMTDRLSSRVGLREKFTWLEEDDFPRQVTTTTAQLVGDTTLILQAGQGKIVQANDHLRNMRTGEGIRISSVATDTLTIVRNVGNLPAVAINANDVFLVVADAQPQGSDFPTPRYLARVLGFNYSQITRTSWSYTGTTTAIELYGGREPAKEAVRKAREHKRKWEAIGFFGMRSFLAAVPPENEPRGTAGGALEFIQTNKQDVNGVLTPSFFDNWITTILPYGDASSKVLFCSPLFAINMSAWVRVGMGAQWQPTPENVFGVQVDAFISGAFGYRLPVVVKKEWAEFPTTNKGFGTYAFLLDLSLIQQIPIRDRDTKLLTDQQPKGKDVVSQEYMREATFEFAQEKAHGILFGVTSPP